MWFYKEKLFFVAVRIIHLVLIIHIFNTFTVVIKTFDFYQNNHLLVDGVLVICSTRWFYYFEYVGFSNKRQCYLHSVRTMHSTMHKSDDDGSAVVVILRGNTTFNLHNNIIMVHVIIEWGR